MSDKRKLKPWVKYHILSYAVSLFALLLSVKLNQGVISIGFILACIALILTAIATSKGFKTGFFED